MSAEAVCGFSLAHAYALLTSLAGHLLATLLSLSLAILLYSVRTGQRAGFSSHPLLAVQQARDYAVSLLLLQAQRVCVCCMASLLLEHTQHHTYAQLASSLLTLCLFWVDYRHLLTLAWRCAMRAHTRTHAHQHATTPGEHTEPSRACMEGVSVRELLWCVLCAMLAGCVYAWSLAADYERLLPRWAPFHARYFTLTHALTVCATALPV